MPARPISITNNASRKVQSGRIIGLPVARMILSRMRPVSLLHDYSPDRGSTRMILAQEGGEGK